MAPKMIKKLGHLVMSKRLLLITLSCLVSSWATPINAQGWTAKQQPEITNFYKSLPHNVTSDGDICWFGSSSWSTWCFASGQSVDQHNKRTISGRYYKQYSTEYEQVIYESMNLRRLEGEPGILTTNQTWRINDPGDSGSSPIVVQGSTNTRCRSSIDGSIGQTYSGSDNYSYQGTRRGSCTSTNDGYTIPGRAPDPGGYEQFNKAVEVKCSDMTYRRYGSSHISGWSKVNNKFKQAHYQFWCDRRTWLPVVSKQTMKDLIR